MDEVSATARSASLRIVLVSPRNPLNIGAAARAMSNFGFSELALVNPYEVAFQEARSAVRSKYILEKAEVFQTLSDAISGCGLVVGTTAVGHRDLHVPLYRLEAAGPLLREHMGVSKAAILFGSEKFGLSNEDLSFCQWLLRIPARAEHGSMNLGQAVASCLNELVREQSAATPQFAPFVFADATSYERITSALTEILQRSGYVNERTAQSTELKIRRLVRRLGLPAADVENWLGILRQIDWKVKQDSTG